MRRTFAHLPAMLLAAMLVSCVGAPVAEQREEVAPPMVLRVARFANLVHQLDCLALAEVHCSRDELRALWAKGWSPADDQQLAAWTAVRRLPVPAEQPERDPAGSLPHPLPSAGLDGSERLRLAGLLASDVAGWRASAGELVGADAAARGARVLAHFGPRFEAWWREEGAALAEAARASIDPILARADLREFLERVRRFYRAPPVEGFTLHVLVIPGDPDRPAYTTQVGDHALLELRRGARASSAVEVAAHELCHRYLSRVAPEVRAASLEAFRADGTAESLAAWALLDEAVATAVGNGLFARHLHEPTTYARRMRHPLYGDEAIDRAARALLPEVERQLESGGSVHDGSFARAYLRAVRGALGDQLARPALQLRQMLLVTEPAYLPAALRLVGGLRIGSAWEATLAEAQERLTRWPGLPAVVFADPGRPEVLPALRALVGDPGLQLRPGEIALRRTGNRAVYLLAASPGEAEALVDRFTACATSGAAGCP